MKYRSLRTALIIAGITFYAYAGDILLFPAHPKTISAETLPYTQMLHSGFEGDTFYVRGRFGVDYPCIGYDAGGSSIFLGINAAAHINMRPSGMLFPVDNFYAVLAVYFSGMHGLKLSWRFYPVYHLSAHLADGYPGDILQDDVRAVSSEMARGEVYYKPFGDILELGAGAGYYYHVCAQKNLRYRGDVSVLFTPNRFLNNMLQPFALLKIESVHLEKHNPGIDVSAGIIGLNGSRGLGLSLRYFNRLHSSYYFERYEKGWGVELTFM